jgi:hypothetical protein
MDPIAVEVSTDAANRRRYHMQKGLLGLTCLALSASSCTTENPMFPRQEVGANWAITAAAGSGAAGVNGHATTGAGGWDLTVHATLRPDGSAHGFTRLVGGATGPVVQVVPPAGARDFWCINVVRTDVGIPGDFRINWYIRDVGDGKTTFDQFQFTSTIGQTCTTLPDPAGGFLSFTQGDFKTHS